MIITQKNKQLTSRRFEVLGVSIQNFLYKFFYKIFYKKTYFLLFLNGFFLFVLAWCPSSYAEIAFGNPNGQITVIEYFDYNCPICRQSMRTLYQIASKNKQVNIILRVVPVIALTSQVVDRAVLASYLQHQFSRMHEAILHVSNRETIPPQQVFDIAKKLGLNTKKLLHDMGSPIITKQIIQNIHGFKKTQQTRVPVILIYNEKNKETPILMIGEQSLEKLQAAINRLYFNQKFNRNYQSKGDIYHDKN